MTWIDITNYKQGEDPKKAGPKTWQLSIGGYLRCVVTKGHVYFPGEWVMHLYPLFSEHQLNLPDVADAEKAQERALETVRDVLKACAKDCK